MESGRAAVAPAYGVQRDCAQPRLRVVELGEPPGFLDRPHERLLDGVLRLAQVPADREQLPDQPPVTPLVQLAHRVAVSHHHSPDRTLCLHESRRKDPVASPSPTSETCRNPEVAGVGRQQRSRQSAQRPQSFGTHFDNDRALLTSASRTITTSMGTSSKTQTPRSHERPTPASPDQQQPSYCVLPARRLSRSRSSGASQVSSSRRPPARLIERTRGCAHVCSMKATAAAPPGCTASSSDQGVGSVPDARSACRSPR